jgi:hypothetical protein
MKDEDLRPRGSGRTVKLHEKGSKQRATPWHRALAEVLRAYIDPPESPGTVRDGYSAPGQPQWERALRQADEPT